MIDIGANLTNESFAADIGEVLERAKKNNIEKIIVTGSSVASSQAALELAQQHPDFLYATAGLHPHAADDFNEDTLDTFKALIQKKAVVAVGETGLDFNRNFSSQENQIRSFEAHLNFAEQTHKPVFLHERDAFDTFHPIMRQHPGLCARAIVHCFTGNLDALKAYLDLGLYIGITGWICDKKRGAQLREIIRYAPIDRLMIETDAPYLMPHRDRLKSKMTHKNRNEPWTLGYTAQALADAHELDVQAVHKKTRDTAVAFFRL